MSIFEIRNIKNRYFIKIFGIRITITNEPFHILKIRFNGHKSFNCKAFDKEINNKVERLFKKYKFTTNINNDTRSKRIAFLATEFNDMGGHTGCVKKMVEMLSEQYEICTFLTLKELTYQNTKTKLPLIEKYSKIDGVNQGEIRNLRNDLLCLFNKICAYSPKVLFAFIHRNDFYGTAILCMIKKYTNIKVIFCNHASHYPALGMSFADAIANSSESTFYVNKVFRGFDKNIFFNYIDDKEENIVDISEEEKLKIRKELGIKDGNYFTLSGASPYKFFNDDSSKYFEMIKDLLEEEPNLQHIVITGLETAKQKQIYNTIFNNSKVKDRIKIIYFTPEYSKIFQSCDLFIDSFPIGSALTHIELMKHKKVSIVSVNEENALYSFHENFPKDYPYMYSNTTDMKNGILTLLHNKSKREEAEKIVYEHYLENFEASKSIQAYINAIENSDNLSSLYYKLDDNKKFNIRIEE